MTPLPDDALAVFRAIAADAAPSQAEQAADWLGIPLNEVGEREMMQWFDWLRDCEEMGDGS